MWRLPLLLGASVVCLSLACASAGSRRSRSSADGRYRFVERVSEAIPPVTLEGTVIVAGGNAEVELYPQHCIYDERSSAQTALFNCEGIMITVDIPMARASYSLRTLVRYPVRTCAQYTTDSSGNRRCVRYSTTYEERPATRTGRLQLVRLEG